jgi:hypothetical protein
MRKMTVMRKVEMGTPHLMTKTAGICLCCHPYQALLRSFVCHSSYRKRKKRHDPQMIKPALVVGVPMRQSVQGTGRYV